MKIPTIAALAICAGLTETPIHAAEKVIDVSEVGFTWAAHMTSPPILVTAGDYQYIAYFDAERRLTLSWRRLDDGVWNHKRFPVTTRWATGAHAQIALTVDADGIIHLIPYRRDLTEAPVSPPEIIYYRSTHPHDPSGMERTYMVSPDEPRPHYPLFLATLDGELVFVCRVGGSGRGNQLLYRYDRSTREWHRISTLHDGQNRMSAYGGPRLGPDGRWHCLWMWRNTPDAATNHTLSYIVSPDLVSWTNAAGQPVELPVTPDNPHVVIDPSPPGGGMINPLQTLGFDSQNRPVASYHKYAPCGNSAIYNSRFEDGEWKSVAATIWNFRWDFWGGGAIGVQIGVGPVKPIDGGRLVQRVSSMRQGTSYRVVDEATLEPIGEATAADIPGEFEDRSWKSPFTTPEIDFPKRPLLVRWLDDRSSSDDAAARYLIRWEHGPVNIGDRPVPKPWPPAAPLRVFKIGKSE